MEWQARIHGDGENFFDVEWVPIADQVVVPRTFAASGVVDGYPIAMTLECVDGAVRCVDLRVAGGGSAYITSEVLRTIPVAYLVKEATRRVMAEKEPDNGGLVFPGTSDRHVPDDIRSEWPDGQVDVFLRWVASVYRRAAAIGDPANVAVQDATGMSRATVGRVLRAARERGILGKNERAYAGGARSRLQVEDDDRG